MIRFIDIETGNVFDGSAPYIHWFNDKKTSQYVQSVGLNYDKQFIIMADSDFIEIKLDSEVFYLADTDIIRYPKDNEEVPVNQNIYGKNYIDLEALKTNYIYKNKHVDSQGKDDAKVGGFQLYSFNIIACGKYVGEITDSFYINGEEFKVGADFVDENESLGINLSNFGAEIPNDVQRAIYEKNINEQKTDWVLINRKWKELLNEYINILGNKGSYKSLINSLNWFEYGDLVKIYEYWKRKEPNRDYLAKRDLTEFLTKSTEYLLYTQQKSTYIGISCAIEKIKKENGGILYESEIGPVKEKLQLVDEPVPSLENVLMMWSKEEMSLKMTLLGNFFATYFMPIHLDLIHCTIEDVIYAQTLKTVVYPVSDRFDAMDGINSFYCNLEKEYTLGNVEAYVKPETPFGFADLVSFDQTKKHPRIIGVEKGRPEKPDQSENQDFVSWLKAYNSKIFKGIGVIIPFDCKLYNIDGTSTITSGSIKIYRDSELIAESSSCYFKHTPDKDGTIHINFNILLQDIGIYKIQISFTRSDGVVYLRTFDFEVKDNVHQMLKMYKLVPRFNKTDLYTKEGHLKWIQEDSSENLMEWDNIADYVLSPVQKNLDPFKIEPDLTYIQFVSATNKDLYEKVHTNQVVVIKKDYDPELGSMQLDKEFSTIHLKRGDQDNFLNDLPNFLWLVSTKYGEFIKTDPSDPELIAEFHSINSDGEKDFFYIIGISLEPNTEKTKKWEYSGGLEKTDRIWIKDHFIPYFYKLEEAGEITDYEKLVNDYTDKERFGIRTGKETYEIEQDDVVCFLPDLKCMRRPEEFMWKFTCKTTDEEIIPVTFRDFSKLSYKTHIDESTGKEIIEKVLPNDSINNGEKEFPVITQPLFGRYDFSILPSPGYYDVTLNYKMHNDSNKNDTKSIESMFLVKKPEEPGAQYYWNKRIEMK